jgi:nicotinamide-nucleotide amidase
LVYIGIKKGKTLLVKDNKFKSKKRNLIQTQTVKEVIKTILKLI